VLQRHNPCIHAERALRRRSSGLKHNAAFVRVALSNLN